MVYVPTQEESRYYDPNQLRQQITQQQNIPFNQFNQPIQQQPQQQQQQQQQQQTSPYDKGGTSKFLNISKFLEANRPQATSMIGKIGSEAQSEAEKIRQGIESARSAYQRQMQTQLQQFQGIDVSKLTPEQQDIYNRIAQARQQQPTQTFQSLLQLLNVSPQQIYDPTKPQAQQGEAYKLWQTLTQPIEIPQENLYQQQLQQAQQYQQQLQQLGTEQGRFQLLQSLFSKSIPQYTLGQSKIDQLLLQTSPEFRGLSQLARSEAKQTQDVLSQAQKESQELANLLAGVSGQAKETLQSKLAEKLTGYSENILKEKLELENQRRKEQFEDIKRRLAEGQALTRDELQMIGLSPDTPLFGVSRKELAEALKYEPMSATEFARTLSPEEYAKYKALTGLAGQENLLAGQEGLIGKIDPAVKSLNFENLLATKGYKADILKNLYYPEHIGREELYPNAWVRQNAPGAIVNKVAGSLVELNELLDKYGKQKPTKDLVEGRFWNIAQNLYNLSDHKAFSLLNKYLDGKDPFQYLYDKGLVKLGGRHNLPQDIKGSGLQGDDFYKLAFIDVLQDPNKRDLFMKDVLKSAYDTQIDKYLTNFETAKFLLLSPDEKRTGDYDVKSEAKRFIDKLVAEQLQKERQRREDIRRKQEVTGEKDLMYTGPFYMEDFYKQYL